MNPRHAAALALMGWYLMMPPTQGDLDDSCKQGRFPVLSDLATSILAWMNPATIKWQRCDCKEHQIDLDAPLHKWKQGGSFETLGACKAEYAESQRPVMFEKETSRTAAQLELIDEGELHPSEKDVQTRADLIRAVIDAQVRSAKCIASDDPRLKEK